MSTTLPDKTNGTTGIIDTPTVGQQKTNFGNLRDFIADLFGITTAALRTVWETFRLHGPDTLANASLTFSVASSALTIALKTRAGANPSATDPVLVGQRSSTAGNGDFNLRAATAATSLVVSSGSTLGHGNSDSTPLYVYLIDNAGTQELAISQKWFGASGIVSTTAEGGAGAADSATVMYSTTARSSVPFRAVAKLTAPQTTAGTWAAVPTVCQPWPFDVPATQTEVDTGADMGKVVSSAINKLSLGTPVSTASGSSAAFTGLPTGIRRITLNFAGVSLNGSDNLRVQIGDSGGYKTSGYLGTTDDRVTTSNLSSGFDLLTGGATFIAHGRIDLELQNASTNTWTATGFIMNSASASNPRVVAGSVALSGALDRIKVIPSGANSFDAGEVNITYLR